jgi:hypothetical protein
VAKIPRQWAVNLRIHKSLRVTPAMAAGLTDKLMGFEDIVALSQRPTSSVRSGGIRSVTP